MVSIIIPYYNRRLKLERTLETVFKQTYQDFEVIVVDDCSEEKPNFQVHHTIQYVRNAENRGPGYSRQIGLKLATGRYVCFLDSDDYWHPTFLERCVAAIEQSTTAVTFVYVKTIYVKSDLEIGIANKSKKSEDTILPNLLVRGRPWDTPACLWDKNILDKHKGWINTRNWEDYAFDVGAAIINNNILAIDEPLLYVENDGDNKLSEQHKEIVEIEKSKSLAFISHTLKDSVFYDDALIKNKVVLHLISNTIALLDLDSNQKKYIEANIKALKEWKPFIFVILIKLLTKINIKIGLTLLRRLRINIQKKSII